MAINFPKKKGLKNIRPFFLKFYQLIAGQLQSYGSGLPPKKS